MNPEIVVAVISLVSNLLGSAIAILVANKLLNYRVDKLEEMVRKNSNFEPRIYDLEKHNEVQDYKISTLENKTEHIFTDVEKLKERA